MLTIEEQLGEKFAEYVTKIKYLWSTSAQEQLAISVRNAMEKLLHTAPENEPWVTKLLIEKQQHAELYRDEDFGFIQMGHFHGLGHASPPHDHGGHWVVYGVYGGEIEISTYSPIGSTGKLKVLETQKLTTGDAYLYLSNEIHSTRQISEHGSVVLRFLSTDLIKVKRNRYHWDQIDTSGDTI